jgi:hypothetical protein
MNTRSVAATLAAFASLVVGCGGALPEVLVLRVDTVQVSATRNGSMDLWDGPTDEVDPRAGCQVMAAAAPFVVPGSGELMSALCGLAREAQGERAPTSPDLRVRLSAGAETTYETFTTVDTAGTRLAYEFLVPRDAIPPEGLRLDVVDDDGRSGSELIGGSRLTQEQLAAAYTSSSKLMSLRSDGITQLEIVVSPYSPEEPIVEVHPANVGPFPMGRAVKAGELVSVRASGTFKVGSWFSQTVAPAGYPGGEAQSYNLGPFKKDPHACVIALIEQRPTLEGVVIGANKDFVAQHAGPLRIGLNDSEPDNNEGNVRYEVSLRAPSAEEWLASGSTR